MTERINWSGVDGQGNLAAGFFEIDTEEPPPAGEATFSGDISLPGGFTVPAGEVWEFNPLVTTIVRVRSNVIVEGTLEMVPANAGVTHTLVFEDVSESAFVGNTHEAVEPTDVGLWVIGDGQVLAHGAEKVPWTRPPGGLAAGQTVVDVDDASGWQVGDELVFTPTVPITVSSFWRGSRFSRRRITGITGNRVILDLGLQNSHPAPIDQNGGAHPCEVLNLTRNVKIMGTPSGRAHAMWMHARNPVHLSNIEVAHLGPRRPRSDGDGTRGILGRYPLHFHLMRDGSRGSLVRNVVTHECGSHAFVPHTSDGMTFDGCVAHNTIDDAFWWDPDTPTSSLSYLNCVVSLVVDDHRAFRLGGFNLNIADHSLPNFQNRIIGCVAVGVHGDNDEVDSAGFLWPELGDFQNQAGEWEFRDNVAHNCFPNGEFVWQNDSRFHLVDTTTIYNCISAIDHGAYRNRYRYRNHLIFGCRNALRLHAATVGAEGLRFEDFDVRVTGNEAWRIASVTAGSVSNPVVFRRCKALGYTIRGAFMWGDGGGPSDDEWPGWWDFHDCEWDNTKPHITIESGTSPPPPGTLAREFKDGVLVAEHLN